MQVVIASSIAGLTAAQSFSGYINYTTVTGYFLQDLTSTNSTGFDYTAVNFGLINQTYTGVSSTGTQWQQFKQVVDSLNANAPSDTVYKVFWLGRHGEGFHNAAETYYGTPAWNCYWSELNGNGTSVWADADLTVNGINQALIANAFWKSEIANQKIPYPQSYYTSPLTRCLRTANLTFSDIPTPEYYPFVPEVKEFLREGISTHTCDRRSNKTYIHSRFPTYTFEAGFAETDELWNANYAETSSAQDVRSKAALDSVFAQDDHTWISITSHSGEIGSILRVLGHRTFSLSTGAVIPVLVKAQFLPVSSSSSATATAPARTSSAYCLNGPPITSIATAAQGCVCSGSASASSASTVKVASSSARASTSSGTVSSTAAISSASIKASSTATASSVKTVSSTAVTASSARTASSMSSSSVHSTATPASSGVESSSITSVPAQSQAKSSSSSNARACESRDRPSHYDD